MFGVSERNVRRGEPGRLQPIAALNPGGTFSLRATACELSLEVMMDVIRRR